MRRAILSAAGWPVNHRAAGCMLGRMKTWIAIALWGLSLLWLAPARAVLPENGMYVDANQSGTGFYIEVQGTTLVMLGFAYDKASGKPLFYLASGTITQAEHGISDIADVIAPPPPPPYEYDYPYRFEANLYRFSLGPCLTCVLVNWDTSEYAVAAGEVELRMADVNRISAWFELADGSVRATTLYRLSFGRAGYDLGREDGRLLPDLRGEWVFVPRFDPGAPAWRFHFTDLELPAEVVVPDFHGTHTDWIMRFHDPVADASLVCAEQGCALEQGEQALFLIKFWDIGTNSLLGYVGDTLYRSDPAAFRYRSDQLIIGKRLADPVPQAAPPPEG